MQRRLVSGLVLVAAPALRRRTAVAAGPLVLSAARRFLATSPPLAAEALTTTAGPREEHGESFVPSAEVRAADEDGADEDEFDELEAASQELHDLCYAMIGHLRRADPEANKALFERRVKRAFREPKPEQYRRLLHDHGDRSLHRRNNYRSHKDFIEAHKLYMQWGDKVLLLLTPPVMERLVKSAGKGYRDQRQDGVHRYRHPIARAGWRSFPHRWFKHAPFEVQQLRADIPESAVLNTRFYRDHATLRYLFTLMEPQHPFRAALERRMSELTQGYDPVHGAR